MLFNAVNRNGPCGSQFCALQGAGTVGPEGMPKLWPREAGDVRLPARTAIALF